jgi:hypothetical protein
MKLLIGNYLQQREEAPSKVGLSQVLMFNKPIFGLLNESSYIAPAVGVTKFITINVMSLVTLCCAT